jgi:hypothetical protein
VPVCLKFYQASRSHGKHAYQKINIKLNFKKDTRKLGDDGYIHCLDCGANAINIGIYTKY